MTDESEPRDGDLYSIPDEFAGIDDDDDIGSDPLSPGFIERCVECVCNHPRHQRFRLRLVRYRRSDRANVKGGPTVGSNTRGSCAPRSLVFDRPIALIEV